MRRHQDWWQTAAVTLCALICSALPAKGQAAEPPADDKPLNVLLICVDDLREPGSPDGGWVQTPHMDRFADEARQFTRHYVYMAACGPSRSTMLSGRRQTSWSYLAPLRQALKREPGLTEPDTPVSMPGLFRRAGYTTISIGKVGHEPDGCVMGSGMREHEMPFSWDRAYSIPGQWETGAGAMFGYADGTTHNAAIWPDSPPHLPYEAADVPDDFYPDALNAAEAVQQLKQLSDAGTPFFLAVGFYRPHLPFNAPTRYWDLYDRNDIPRPAWTDKPRNVPVDFTLHNSYEPTSHYHWPSGLGNISDDEGQALRHAYAASVSYIDAQIGTVLDACRGLGLNQNTVIVLWSDHGWHVGEHGIYGKYTAHEHSLRSPLIIRVPNMPRPGQDADGIVESIDLYPTLAALCGLDAPDDLQGTDLSPMLQDPDHPGKAGASSIQPRGGDITGRSLRTDRYRLTVWTHTPTGETRFVELYDHETDPLETNNIADDHPDTVAHLRDQLEQELARDRE